ncbi:MAG: RNA 2',3'-cyclic phosphodiesterase [Deltaproteobacteria bacterium]|jgi:2'-5' RNA ligase|nr:RNA 2',3'-cyclic phosphodiesterase [Deltaproteobacteria bacterium]
MALRLFTALTVPRQIKDRLLSLDLPCPKICPNIHLTLKFIGQTDEQLIPALSRTLAAIDSPKFELTVAGLGLFKPGILWAGVKDKSSVRDLQQKIGASLRQALKMPEDKKSYFPHITLVRLKAPPSPDLLAAVSGSAGRDYGTFSVDSFCLFKSDLEPTGAVHTLIKSFPLTAETG